MMKEKTIVTLTSYGKRLGNLPIVLDTIFNQTMQPDLVVLNLAFGESVPEDVVEYLKQHDVEVNRVPDTKVYKKLIPTLKRYQEACVISIDDDFLYPQGMIEDFLYIHQHYPNNPISGNRVVCYGMQCHCGCASLTKREYFGDLLEIIDDTLMLNCPSDDLVYTYLAAYLGHPYLRTKEVYYDNMISFNEGESYSDMIVGNLGIEKTFMYMVERLGEKRNSFSGYIEDVYLASFLDSLYAKVFLQEITDAKERGIMETENRIRSSYAYRLGKALLKPLSWIKRIG